MRQRHVVPCLWGVGVLAVSIIAGAYVLTSNLHRDKPIPFIDPVALCVVPGMFQQARKGDIPIGYWQPCKDVSRQQDI